jgi:hypothetical protein
MSAKKKDYTLTKDNERTIAEKGIEQAREMLAHFTRKAVTTERPDKKAEYNAFVRTWKLTLATRQAEWAKNYGTAKKA